MKKRLHDKKAGIAILLSLIIISVAEVIFRAVALGEAVLTTANLGEQLAVIALAVIILVLTAKGKDRACYILYGAWIGYFVIDHLFELPSAIIRGVAGLMAETGNFFLILGWVFHVVSMIGIIAIGVMLIEYMCDGTICNRAFNTLSIITVLTILGHFLLPTVGSVIGGDIIFLLDAFNCLYRLTMVFLFAFFAYDSAKAQLKKTNLTK